MKRILIVNNNLHIGGVQRALVDLLEEIHDRYEITLALFHPHGALLEQVPKDVKILPIRSDYRFLGMANYDVAKKPWLRLRRGFYAAISRLLGRKAAISLMALGQKKIAGFDVAVSYLHDAGDRVFYGGCNDFVLRHTDAPVKVAFLHCDYSACGADTKNNAAAYGKFHRIAACSAGCRESFLQVLPEFSKKTVVVSNCHNYNSIWQIASKSQLSLPSDQINVLTVARLGREKGVSRGVEAISALAGICPNVHYYIIGDGAGRGAVQELIRERGLQEKVTLLGELTQPYGYMKAADLLMIPSVSEAAPLVIGEAACLGTPVLSTRTSSAQEMIEQTGYGWVCGNSTQELTRALGALLEDPTCLSEKRQQLRGLEFHNQTATAQFAALTEGKE